MIPSKVALLAPGTQVSTARGPGTIVSVAADGRTAQIKLDRTRPSLLSKIFGALPDEQTVPYHEIGSEL